MDAQIEKCREEMRRRFEAERIIFMHGYVPLGFLPDVTVEKLEAFAAELMAADE